MHYEQITITNSLWNTQNRKKKKKKLLGGHKPRILHCAGWQQHLVRRLVESCSLWRKPPVSGLERFVLMLIVFKILVEG